MYLGFYTFGIGHFSSLLYHLLLLLRIQYSSVFKSNYRISKLKESVTNFAPFLTLLEFYKSFWKPKIIGFFGQILGIWITGKVGNTIILKDLANHNHLWKTSFYVKQNQLSSIINHFPCFTIKLVLGPRIGKSWNLFDAF